MRKSNKLMRLIIILIIVGGIIWWWAYKRPKEAIKSQINSVIAGFDFNNPQSFYSVSEISEIGKEAIPILQEMINSDSISERWAAIISLPGILRDNEDLKDTIIPSLKQRIDDEDDTLKMLVGAQLVSFGEKEGIPVLISCLGSEEITHFGAPPELVKERSLLYLQNYTDFDGKTIQEWQQFWENNKNQFSWNENKEIFEVE
ncbi:HEAT repeat domain-containing protein [Patescibacteria group bacterium]|nr:HEAT repeat domain-containing protein [Patescibacteria group bacterium]